jgi:hypothetical protein
MRHSGGRKRIWMGPGEVAEGVPASGGRKPKRAPKDSPVKNHHEGFVFMSVSAASLCSGFEK